MWRWVICAAALALAGCGSTDKMHYKMTVEVETPEGLRTGSAVREITVRRPASVPMLGEDKGSVRVDGDAVAVDLPKGQTLFALLNSGDGDPDYAGRNTWFLFREIGEPAPEGKIELWPSQPETRSPRIRDPLPMLVTFRDANDPKTVEKVDPSNLGAHFGSQVRLKRITIEHSSDPITQGIEKTLLWLPELHGSYLHGKSTSRGAPLGLHGGDFSTETYK